MLAALTGLPKLIDAFIAGVVEFFYRFAAGVLRIDAAPLRGAVNLQIRAKALSSRTMLFLGACVCGTARFVTVPNLDLLRKDSSLVAIFPRIVVIYVLFDLASHAGATLVGGPPGSRRTARSLMRYGFSASLVTTGMVALAVQALSDAGQVDLEAARAFTRRDGVGGITLLLLGAVVITVASWYQPATILLNLAKRREHKPRRMAGIAVGTGLAAVVLGHLLYGMELASARADGVLGGRIWARNLVCEMTGDRIRVTAAIFNDRINPVALSRRSLWLRVAPEFAQGARASQAMRAEHFDVVIRKLDGDVLLLKPGDAAVLRAEAQLNAARVDDVGRRTGAAACSLTPRKFDMPDLFRSAAVEMDLVPPADDAPMDDSGPLPADADPPNELPVPRYDPHRLDRSAAGRR